MSFHEQHPWSEPQRTSQIHEHIIIGSLITIAMFILLATIELRAALLIAALAAFTLIVLAVGNWATRRRERRRP
ncbi:hypothetical protein ACWFRJ_15720 [Streptomyces sp. NPDC055239]